MSAPTRIRLSLDVSAECADTLERLAESSGSGSLSEVLRKAIALMVVAVDAKRRGQRVGIASKDQQLVTEVIGL